MVAAREDDWDTGAIRALDSVRTGTEKAYGRSGARGLFMYRSLLRGLGGGIDMSVNSCREMKVF